jgi:hypothetical protein
MKHTAVAESRFFNAGAYFEPDVLVSFEYSKANRRRDQYMPEEKLLFAVLSDAIECFQKYIDGKSRRYRRLFSEAQVWIMNCDDRSVFSFEFVCEALQLDPSYLRMGLNRWRADRNAPRSSHKRIREPLRYQYRLRNSRISA